MAKIDVYIPEPSVAYDVENQRQILSALALIKEQLNTSFLNESVEDLQTFSWFIGGGSS